MFGIIIGLTILMVLIIFKVSIVIVAPIASSIIAILNDLNVLEVLNNYYLLGFANFVQDYLFIFLLSAMLGKIIESSGDTTAIGEYIIDVLDYKYVAVGVFFISAALVYGGISGFVLIFTIYPIAKSVFEKAGLSKSLILAAIAGGNVIIGIPMPGSPQIHNLIMMNFLNTSAVTGLKIGLISILCSLIFSIWYLLFRTKRLLGDRFNSSKNNIFKKTTSVKFKKFLLALLPLITVFISLAILRNTPVVSLLLGVIVSLMKNIKRINLLNVINNSISNAAIPLMFAASAMGFGEVISSLPVFKEFLQMILNLSLNPYILVGIITNVSAGLLGSASGGMLLTISTVEEQLIQLIDPIKLHRILIIASTGLDTLPHNTAYLTMLSFTGLKLKDTYFDYFVVTLLAPLIALVVAIVYAVFFSPDMK